MKSTIGHCKVTLWLLGFSPPLSCYFTCEAPLIWRQQMPERALVWFGCSWLCGSPKAFWLCIKWNIFQRDTKDVSIFQWRLYLFFFDTYMGTIRKSNPNQAATLFSKYILSIYHHGQKCCSMNKCNWFHIFLLNQIIMGLMKLLNFNLW